jgi:thioredoxin 1
VDLRDDRPEPSRAEVDALLGPTVLEFGTDWCGYCQAAQPLVVATLAPRPEVRHLKITDGKGRSLGRSFGVKLWPTFIFLRDGREQARVVRPTDPAPLQRALAAISDG